MILNRVKSSTAYTQSSYWDSKAQEYGPEGASGWINQRLNSLYHQKEVSLLDSFLPDVQGRDVLDAGCGTGRISRYFARRGAHVVGIDFSPLTIDIARKLGGDPPPAYRVQSVLELADDQQFDIAVTSGVLCVACAGEASLAQAMRNLYRALRPGGRIMLAEPLHRGFLGLSLKMGAGQIVATIREAGFTIESVAPLHFWPISRPLCYLPLPAAITCPMYALGEIVLRHMHWPSLGDYKVIRAFRAPPR